jgi:hypothetical protein
MVLDRVHPVETTHHVKVERTVKLAGGDLTSRLLDIALTFGLDPQKVLATPKNAVATPATIEGECREIE